MSAESVLAVFTLLVLVPTCGIVLAVTPWIMSKGELFSVSVPAVATGDPEVRSLKRAYSMWILALTAALTACIGYALVATDPNMAVLAGCAATIVLVLASYLSMLHFRGKVQSLKLARGWKATSQEHAAMLGGADVPRPVSLRWELLNLLPIAASLLVALLGYDAAPDLIPVHQGFDGVVNGWAEKSVQTMLMPVVLQLAIAGTTAFCHAMILRSKRPVDPRLPASSAVAYGAYARAWSAWCVGMGVAINASVVALEASLVGWVSLGFAGAAITLATLAMLVPCIVLAVRYGQNGTRLLDRLPEGAALCADDDEHWRGGVFYANREDPAVVVPRRFGIGWTLNMGRPAGWLIVAAFLAICVACLVVAVQG